MKKIISILLCLCILLTGCQSKDKNKAINNTEDENNSSNISQAVSNTVSNTVSNDDSNTPMDTPEPMVKKLLNLNSEWSLVETFQAIDLNYEEPSYEAKVPSYTVAKDLSNIENIGQFSGFTKNQINMLVKNRFVVIPSIDTKIFYTYDSNEYKGIPDFITSDCALHLYHQFYDKSLMNVEAAYLYKDLELMTKQMLDKSILLLKELQDEDLKKLQEKNIVYFMVARMLFTQTSKLKVEADQKLIDLAKQEYDLCQAAGGIQNSPLFQKDFDYSQFKVRGHYTRSEELGKFFKTMMWFGTAPFAFTDQNHNVLYDNVLQSLLITFTTFSDSETTCDAKLWSDIYQPTSQYVGLSDDINVLNMNTLRLSVYGNSDDPNVFNDDTYKEKLAQAVKELPEPQIAASLSALTTPTGKQFRFMGQRYILDSDILQKLIDNKKRPIPSSLDVCGVLGSNVAENLLFNVYKPQIKWPEYKDKYNNLKKMVSTYTADYWKTNLYSGWLWSIQDVLKEYTPESKMPSFMTNDAWKYKSLNTALGSYTELKHDSVLYGKQPIAEMGGPDDFADQHYVEPDITLYNKLLYLTDFTASILEEKGMLNDRLKQGADSYKKFLNLLISCSEKELSNQPLSKEEKKQLLWSGGTMENIINNFQASKAEDYESDISDMLASDISTYMNTYLTLGTGYFDQIYVVVPVEGKLYLTRGSVYSFYVFTSNTRLTDEEWWALQGIKKIKDEYGEYMDIGKPSASLPNQPSWIKYFKTGSNGVKLKSLDTDWDKLNE